jgi:hypothetical protein
VKTFGYPRATQVVHHLREHETDENRGRWAMNRWVLALGVLLLTPVLLPRVAIAGPSTTTGASVRVVVDTKALGDAEAPFAAEIDQTLRAAVEEAGYVLDDSVRADATVRVRLSFFNQEDLDYQIDVDIAAGEQLVRLETVGCPHCEVDQLLARVDGRHTEILAALERALVRSREHVPPEGETPEGETPPVQEQEPGKPKPFGTLGGLGIGLAVLGVGTIVAGGVELGRGTIYDDVSRVTTERSFVDHRPVGGALLGVGGVVLAAGVTMLVVDIVRSKKHRHAGLAVPLLGPSIVGLGYTGQF